MKWIRNFISAAGVVLLVAALVRFLIAAGSAEVLSLPEPLLSIPLRYAVLLVGGLELAGALICLFGKRLGLQIGWLAWLGTNYIVFWAGLVWQQCSPQGSCIGGLTDPLRLYQGTAGYLLQFMPFGLAVGSYAAAASLWFSGGARQPEAERDAKTGMIKMICPACGTHVQFAPSKLGQQIPCPNCRGALVLRRPDENLKTACVLCGGHIEFPPHAIGRKIPCPHCAEKITLLDPIGKP